MVLGIEFDPFEIAQAMQRQIMGLPFDKRIELAVGSLEILAPKALELQAQAATFMVDCRTAVARPHQTFGPKQTLIHFGNLALEGSLIDFSYVSIGKLDRNPVNSLVAAFERATLWPGLETLQAGDVVYVPVLAIDQTVRTS